MSAPTLDALLAPTERPAAITGAAWEAYLAWCSPEHRAYLTAPAYGVLFADAHSSVHPDLVGPIWTSRAEAQAACAAALAEHPDRQAVVMAGVTVRRRALLADEGFEIDDADLMAPGTRIFIDRFGRTPKALLRALRRGGEPLEADVPAPEIGVL